MLLINSILVEVISNSNDFWTSTSVICSAVSVIITSFTVMVALWQYRQPINKKLKIKLTAEILSMDTETTYCITVINTGIREVVINDIYFYTGIIKKHFIGSTLPVIRENKIELYNLQNKTYGNSERPCIVFPKKLLPEDLLKLYFLCRSVIPIISEYISGGIIKETTIIKIVVVDTTGKKYLYNTKLKAIQFVDVRFE